MYTEEELKTINDPDFAHEDGEPYLLKDENGETIISRTAKGINEGKINPFKTEMKEVTLFHPPFVRQFLECIDTEYLMIVAQAIDHEDAKHAQEDGRITHIQSDSSSCLLL